MWFPVLVGIAALIAIARRGREMVTTVANKNYSPLAKQVHGVRNPSLGTPKVPGGFLIHTTGSGITHKARELKQYPIDVAIKTYIASQNGSNGYFWGGPGYVLDHEGNIYQIAPDNIVTNHAGSIANRPKYLNGSWVNLVTPNMLAMWRAKWPQYSNPYTLFPGKSPNFYYVGIEMIPCADGYGIPMRPGLRFTKAQHDSIIKLGRDLAIRHGWPKGWNQTARLLGHEDVDPIDRDDSGGGWDPGYLRMNPYFDFEYVRNNI